jgi:hypothetical protein
MSTSARSEAAASAARASEASAARAAEASAARAAEASAARAAEASVARCTFLASACDWASTCARPAACVLKSALVRAVRRALAFERRCRLGPDVLRGLGVGGGDVLFGGGLASASSTDAPACTAATVTTYNSNATRGRRSGARLRSGLRRFASTPLEPRYPPRPSPLPSCISLSNNRNTSRKRWARALTFWGDIYRAAADTMVVGPRAVTSAPSRPTSGPQSPQNPTKPAQSLSYLHWPFTLDQPEHAELRGRAGGGVGGQEQGANGIFGYMGKSRSVVARGGWG